MLTEAGRCFLPYAEVGLAAFRDGVEAVKALRGEERGGVEGRNGVQPTAKRDPSRSVFP